MSGVVKVGVVNVAQSTRAQYSPVLSSTAQHIPLQPSTAHYSPAQPTTAQYSPDGPDVCTPKLCLSKVYFCEVTFASRSLP